MSRIAKPESLLTMNLRDNRTILLILIVAVALVMLLNPGWLRSVLDTVQSIVIIVLGIVATAYLWKRM
jgi:hypothetical protein